MINSLTDREMTGCKLGGKLKAAANNGIKKKNKWRRGEERRGEERRGEERRGDKTEVERKEGKDRKLEKMIEVKRRQHGKKMREETDRKWRTREGAERGERSKKKKQQTGTGNRKQE